METPGRPRAQSNISSTFPPSHFFLSSCGLRSIAHSAPITRRLRAQHLRSATLLPPRAPSPSRKKQASAVVDHFKVNTFHVLGHGTGAAAALQMGKSLGKASPRPPGPELEAVLSVTLASPVLGENELSSDFLDTLRAPYTKGGNEVRLLGLWSGERTCEFVGIMDRR